MPKGANPPAKPEGYKKQAKQFLQQFESDTGIKIRPPSEKRDTYLAHVGAKFAREKGMFDAYHQRIFEAVWKHDEDIADTEVLCAIAKEAGLQPQEFEQAIHAETYKAMVDADFQLAEDWNIWTIPSYIGSNGEIQVHHFEDAPSIEELKKIL
ncbi:DSBA-like thioredoxin domain-containing protein [Alteribacillus persepolensis]|uniref:DSBA-like thioredoxin domain-containing protein n=1 Tax=Alteribacillus persepolensis TaxID=568899 RepID=A0A1G8EG69_9BACI|nr:DSBA-like thioredoxin domain-containing protein [Alteribacillus persepolensis]